MLEPSPTLPPLCVAGLIGRDLHLHQLDVGKYLVWFLRSLVKLKTVSRGRSITTSVVIVNRRMGRGHHKRIQVGAIAGKERVLVSEPHLALLPP